MSSPSQYADLTKYQKIRQIGKGVFGEVYLVKEKETQKTYAAKIIQSEATDKQQDVILYLSREVNITAGINHPAVLHLVGNYNRTFGTRIIIRYYFMRKAITCS
ncbi:hypothetical protein M9Y10_020805 [Tritrichomonas musculus]|uniref:Protein kinase domain-containing protein n=1 Tax=Tritrichomonas musculus TaxID=1915356 RepID=A0ABR2HGM2_9EUKA